jgi:hypothetical protein
MSNKTITGILLALVTSVAAIAPALAQYYVNVGPYGNPYYNNYAYRGYTPCDSYGYVPRHYYTARNVAIGAGIGAGVGAAIGLLASHHGHRYRY